MIQSNIIKARVRIDTCSLQYITLQAYIAISENLLATCREQGKMWTHLLSAHERFIPKVEDSGVANVRQASKMCVLEGLRHSFIRSRNTVRSEHVLLACKFAELAP